VNSHARKLSMILILAAAAIALAGCGHVPVVPVI
jgi:hypothetical protein